jgi:hypothetical protein
LTSFEPKPGPADDDDLHDPFRDVASRALQEREEVGVDLVMMRRGDAARRGR